MNETAPLQQVVRLPNVSGTYIRPGDWIVLRPTHKGDCWRGCRCRRVREVCSVHVSITQRDQRRAKLRLVFADGTTAEPRQVERFATDAERREAEARKARTV